MPVRVGTDYSLGLPHSFTVAPNSTLSCSLPSSFSCLRSLFPGSQVSLLLTFNLFIFEEHILQELPEKEYKKGNFTWLKGVYCSFTHDHRSLSWFQILYCKLYLPQNFEAIVFVFSVAAEILVPFCFSIFYIEFFLKKLSLVLELEDFHFSLVFWIPSIHRYRCFLKIQYSRNSLDFSTLKITVLKI